MDEEGDSGLQKRLYERREKLKEFYHHVSQFLENVQLRKNTEIYHPRRLRVFIAIAEADKISLKDLGEMFDLPPAALWSDLIFLTDNQWVKKEIEGPDSRYKSVEMTERGYDVLEELALGIIF